MTAIWQNSDSKWSLVNPSGFEDEAALHKLVEATPEMLPLSGSPRLAILGSEVRLGTGSADLVGIEADGRLAVIEIKLRANPEARRAVVAQVLAYAANLYRMPFEYLESTVLQSHLASRGFTTIADAVAHLTQNEVDSAALRSAVESRLESGSFRLILVLDEIPSELVTVVGYLEAISPEIVIDLVAVAGYSVGGSQIVVPQRVEPARVANPATTATPPKQPEAPSSPGPEGFLEAVVASSEPTRTHLMSLVSWAKDLADRQLAVIGTTHGKTRKTLWVRVKGTDSGIVTIATDHGGSVWVWPTVLGRYAPEILAELESRFGSPIPNLRPDAIDAELLASLTRAYEVAQATRIRLP